MICYTKKGTKVDVSFVEDVEPNEGGWYCEIAHHDTLQPFDNFCIHKEDCNCDDYDEFSKFAKEYVANITEY